MRQKSLLDQKLEALQNRLLKNWQAREKMGSQRRGVNCFRVYDADIPEFNAAIDFLRWSFDLFKNMQHLQISRCKSPRNVGGKIIEAVLDSLPMGGGVMLTRDTYPANANVRKASLSIIAFAEEGVMIEVQEYNAKFLVNLTDYLDTGLFLDHRWVRKDIPKNAQWVNRACLTCSLIQARHRCMHRVFEVVQSKLPRLIYQNLFELGER